MSQRTVTICDVCSREKPIKDDTYWYLAKVGDNGTLILQKDVSSNTSRIVGPGCLLSDLRERGGGSLDTPRFTWNAG